MHMHMLLLLPHTRTHAHTHTQHTSYPAYYTWYHAHRVSRPTLRTAYFTPARCDRHPTLAMALTRTVSCALLVDAPAAMDARIDTNVNARLEVADVMATIAEIAAVARGYGNDDAQAIADETVSSIVHAAALDIIAPELDSEPELPLQLPLQRSTSGVERTQALQAKLSAKLSPAPIAPSDAHRIRSALKRRRSLDDASAAHMASERHAALDARIEAAIDESRVIELEAAFAPHVQIDGVSR